MQLSFRECDPIDDEIQAEGAKDDYPAVAAVWSERGSERRRLRQSRFAVSVKLGAGAVNRFAVVPFLAEVVAETDILEFVFFNGFQLKRST